MSAELKYWYLHEHRLFRNLSFTEIDSLCILKRFRKSKKDEIVHLPYSEKERIYFLKHGTLKLIKVGDNDEEVLVDIIHKGDLFGELNLENTGENHEYMKVVSDEAIICTFFRERLEELIVRKPEFALNYIKFIGFNFKKFENSYRNILFKDARTRLLLLLKMLVEKENITSGSYQLPDFLTQKDIAHLICTTRQTVITLFKELEKDGILSYNHKEVTVLDSDRLRILAQSVK